MCIVFVCKIKIVKKKIYVQHMYQESIVQTHQRLLGALLPDLFRLEKSLECFFYTKTKIVFNL